MNSPNEKPPSLAPVDAEIINTVGAGIVGAANSDRTAEPFSQEDYYEALGRTTFGPQIEGLSPEEIDAAAKDPKTLFIHINTPEGEIVSLPWIVPINYASWINKKFFEDRGVDPENLYYSSLPQYLLKENPEAAAAALEKFKELDEGATVVIDYPEGIQPYHESLDPADYDVDDLVTSVGTPAATFHYAMKIDANPEKMGEYTPNPAIRRIDEREEIDRNFDRIWDIYSGQFKGLVDDHPIEGALPKQELYETLVSSDSKLFAYINGDGQIDAFGYLVNNLDLCPWLNKEKIEAEAEGRPVSYMPGIAAAPECEISAGVEIMQQLQYDAQIDHPNWMITFECSNISAQYIPKLVHRTTKGSQLSMPSTLSEQRHFYKTLRFN